MGIWKDLTKTEQLDTIMEDSYARPAVIYKHSTRCGTSMFVRRRLEHDWDFDHSDIDVYFLDLLAHRDISDEIERRFSVRHESPQIVVIAGGEAIYSTSHGGVTVNAIKGALHDHKAG